MGAGFRLSPLVVLLKESHQMAETIRLKHIVHTMPEFIEYFYDGQAPVKDGVIELPADNPTWLQRSWILGYRINPETGEEVADWRTLLVDESAESAGDTKDARPARGRRPNR